MLFKKYFPPVSRPIIYGLLLLTLFCLSLSLLRYITTGTSGLLFLVWNLFLAWIPLVFAWLFFNTTRTSGLVWALPTFIYALLWLIFFPNALYVVTDFVHLSGWFDDPDRMYDIVLIFMYAVTGTILGLFSLLLIHIRTIQRFGDYGHTLPVVVLVLAGFAIYLGRYLRWNSWDVVINPFGLLFDVSDRIVNPTNHVVTFTTTALFFVLYGVLYIFTWSVYRTFKQK